MNCHEISSELVSAAYGELPPGQQQAVDAHLSSCPSCRAEFEAVAAGRNLLDRLRDDSAVPALDTRRLFHTAAVRAQRQRRTWKRLAAVCALSALALALLVLSRVKFDVSAQSLVVSWGRPANSAAAPQFPSADGDMARLRRQVSELANQMAAQDRAFHSLAEQARTTGELAQLATRELLAVDRRHSDDLDRLRQALDRLGQSTTAALTELREQGEVRWKLTVHELSHRPELNAVSVVESAAPAR
jgi:hypothetical protein